jgi:hypothetical protein
MKQHIDEIALTLLILLVFVGGVSAETLYVNETGWHRSGGAFNTTGTPIQHGVDNATAGDTVYVWNGTYNENVNLTQASITLEGEGRDVVTLNASNTSISTVSIWNDMINVSGFTLQNATNGTGDSSIWYVSGVFIHRATDHCKITDNNMCYNNIGIYIIGWDSGKESTYIDIKRNNMYNNSKHAAYAYYKIQELNFSDNVIYNNTCSGSSAFRTYSCDYYWNRVHNNTFYDNYARQGALYIRSDKFYISNNTIYNTTGDYFEEAGIHVVSRPNTACIIEYNEIYWNGEVGIHICNSNNVTIRYNNVYNNSYVVSPDWTFNMRCWSSEDITFIENTVAQVDDYHSYQLGAGSKVIVTDEITDYNWFYLKYATPSELEVKSTTNKILKSNTTNLTYCYPAFTNLSINRSEIQVKVTAYNGTLTPGTTNVTISAVNSWNESAGYNITVNSSNATETCTFTVDVANASDNYGCYVDGVWSVNTPAIAGVVSWEYTGGFSEHDLEVKWNSTGVLSIELYADEYALINNWTTAQTFAQIASNMSNDVCFSYYNSTSGLWEAYYVGYTYNANAAIPMNSTAMVFVDGDTTISATPNTGGVTITQATWFYSYLPGSTAKTLTEIETAMDADGLDVWALYGWNNATQAYTSTGGYSVAPNEGYTVYCNVTGEYTP